MSPTSSSSLTTSRQEYPQLEDRTSFHHATTTSNEEVQPPNCLPPPFLKHLFVLTSPLSLLYKRNECRRKKYVVLLINWLPDTFTFVFHCISSFLLHSVFRRPLFEILSSYLFSPVSFLFHPFHDQKKTTAILDQWSDSGASLFSSVRYSSSLLLNVFNSSPKIVYKSNVDR